MASILDRAQALSRSTPASKELNHVVNENIRKGADEMELEDIRQIMSTDAGKRFFQNMIFRSGMFDSEKIGSSEVYWKDGKQYFPKYYFSLIGKADKELQSQLCPPLKPPYEFEAKRIEMKKLAEAEYIEGNSDN